MLPLRQNNPLAPAAYNGLSSIGSDFEDGDFCKTAQFVIAANSTNLNLGVQLDKDADFLLTAIYALSDQTGGGFAVRFADQSGYYLNDNFLSSFALTIASTGVGIPFVLPIPLRFPKGSQILIDLIEQSGHTNTIQFLFRAMKHFV